MGRFHYQRDCRRSMSGEEMMLRLDESGALARLRDFQWYQGRIPDDMDAHLRLLHRLDDDQSYRERIWPAICKFFERDEDGYFDPEIEKRRTRTIYALRDPRCGSTRYIGQTSDPERRERSHRHDRSNPDKLAWAKELEAAGLRPEFVVLERSNVFESNARELAWIEREESAGSDLLNNSKPTPSPLRY